MKTKKYFAEQILISLTNEHLNIDNKIDEREVFLRMDATVNELAQKNFFENWKFSGYTVDSQYLTTFDVDVVDQDHELPSYFIFPSNYIALPRNAGIVEVAPIRWTSIFEPAVVVISPEDFRRLLSNPAARMQGRLSGYPDGNRFYFTSCGVNKKYGQMRVRLAIRDSSQILDNQPYGIPADKENALISTVVAWYRIKREVPKDSVRDNKDQP